MRGASGPSPPDRTDAPIIVALMIGKLKYMPTLNRISAAIVARAVAVWRDRPGSVLVCESAPMAAAAVRLGLDASAVTIALPQPAGHTTRLVALWCARWRFAGRKALLITQALHARRSAQIFARAGIPAGVVPVDLPFDRHDPDWKLRSGAMFRFYSAVAHVHCRCRGWIYYNHAIPIQSYNRREFPRSATHAL